MFTFIHNKLFGFGFAVVVWCLNSSHAAHIRKKFEIKQFDVSSYLGVWLELICGNIPSQKLSRANFCNFSQHFALETISFSAKNVFLAICRRTKFQRIEQCIYFEFYDYWCSWLFLLKSFMKAFIQFLIALNVKDAARYCGWFHDVES